MEDASAELRKRRSRPSSKYNANQRSSEPASRTTPDKTANTFIYKTQLTSTISDCDGDDDVFSKPSNINLQQRPAPFDADDDSDTTHTAFRLNINFDPMTMVLFAMAVATRIYRLSEPNDIVFDELHYGKYVSLYMKQTFFFDQHPPFGKQLIAGIAYLVGYSGNFTFSRIGSGYSSVCVLCRIILLY